MSTPESGVAADQPSPPNGSSNGSATPQPETRKRVPLTVDPLGAQGAGLASTDGARVDAAANLYAGMAQVHSSLLEAAISLTTPTAPSQLIGILLQPDGTPAARVQLQFNPANFGSSSPVVSTQTDQHGSFHLLLPSGMSLPGEGFLSLVVHGAGSGLTVEIPVTSVAANGLLGAVTLPSFVAPLPLSVVAALEQLVPPPPPGAPTPTTSTGNPPQKPVVQIGEDPQTLLTYGVNNAVDSFPYGVFFRLVEPRASIVSQVRRQPALDGLFTFLPDYETSVIARTAPHDAPQAATAPALSPQELAAPTEGQPATMAATSGPPPGTTDVVAYVDRVPVEQPISVDGFRDQMMGLKQDGTFTADETRPMAGTLGLGYILYMSQRWTFQGLTLGNLVYSLPLAPGEQQQVAVFERVDSAQVTDTEIFSEEQAQQQSALADTSTQATFNSAFQEAVHGESAFATESTTKSAAVSFIFAAASIGTSSASGSTSQSLQGQRNTTQQAAQNTHSAAENQASARRRASRTGMRIATASETQRLSTRTITNHNHTRALTMQYWEVERLYEVTTAIDGLSLTVLVPLQLVRFMPAGQPAALTSAEQVGTRSQVLERYRSIIAHAEVLARDLPRPFHRGLTMLMQFAADPTATVEPAGAAAEDVIQFELTGGFLPCEDVFISVVTDRGTRLGPVKLGPPPKGPAPDIYSSRDQLVEWLSSLRQISQTTLSGALAVPTALGRGAVVGFEITRSFRTLPYTLLSPAVHELQGLNAILPGPNAWLTQALQSTLVTAPVARQTVFLSPAELESALGGPRITHFKAGVEQWDRDGQLVSAREQYANAELSGIVLPAERYPVPASQLAPVLRYSEVLEIERMATHVVRGTLPYSRSVWASMSGEERAILLEAYTIGVPPGGVADPTDMVPLLNCVENRVLGFFGNSMIMPFTLPQSLATHGTAGGQVDPAKIEETLLAYQRAAFTPPRSTIALPTQGVLGEAVLGHSPSAEKIDLTRFWNWQDSASDSAPAMSPITLPTGSPSLAAGLSGPSDLTKLPSLINNVLTAPTPDSALLQSLAKEAAAQKDFDPSLTGSAQLAGLITNAQNVSNSARSDALKSATETTQQAVATVGNIVGGLKGNPTAGSSALAALKGGGAKDDAAADKPTPKPDAGADKPDAGADKPDAGADKPGTPSKPDPAPAKPDPAPAKPDPAPAKPDPAPVKTPPAKPTDSPAPDTGGTPAPGGE